MENSALRARFDRFDTDGNGQINEIEFGRLLDALGLGYSPSQIRTTFSTLDKDQSGQIDFNEFSNWWARH